MPASPASGGRKCSVMLVFKNLQSLTGAPERTLAGPSQRISRGSTTLLALKFHLTHLGKLLKSWPMFGGLIETKVVASRPLDLTSSVEAGSVQKLTTSQAPRFEETQSKPFDRTYEGMSPDQAALMPALKLTRVGCNLASAAALRQAGWGSNDLFSCFERCPTSLQGSIELPGIYI